MLSCVCVCVQSNERTKKKEEKATTKCYQRNRKEPLYSKHPHTHTRTRTLADAHTHTAAAVCVSNSFRFFKVKTKCVSRRRRWVRNVRVRICIGIILRCICSLSSSRNAQNFTKVYGTHAIKKHTVRKSTVSALWSQILGLWGTFTFRRKARKTADTFYSTFYFASLTVLARIRYVCMYVCNCAYVALSARLSIVKFNDW